MAAPAFPTVLASGVPGVEADVLACRLSPTTLLYADSRLRD